MLPWPAVVGCILADVLRDAAPGATVDLEPGRFLGPVVIDRPLTIRGRGDLTRVFVEGHAKAPVIIVRGEGPVVIESITVERSLADEGGAVRVEGGELRIINVHVLRCKAGAGGGLVATHGDVHLERVRFEQVEAESYGGAVLAKGDARVWIKDSQFETTQARFGGAIAVLDRAHVELEGVTISKSRATTSVGGQAIFVQGSEVGAPYLLMTRVRMTDRPLWSPLVHDRVHPGQVIAKACDLPRLAGQGTGIVDQGDNLWR